MKNRTACGTLFWQLRLYEAIFSTEQLQKSFTAFTNAFSRCAKSLYMYVMPVTHYIILNYLNSPVQYGLKQANEYLGLPHI